MESRCLVLCSCPRNPARDKTKGIHKVYERRDEPFHMYGPGSRARTVYQTVNVSFGINSSRARLYLAHFPSVR
jgi:hypothetical protein